MAEKVLKEKKIPGGRAPSGKAAKKPVHNSRKKVILITAIILAVILVAVGVTLLVMYLTGDRPIKQTEEEKRVVGTCGGMEIQYEELRFVAMTYRDTYEKAYGKEVWNDPDKCEEFRETVLSVLRNNYAVFKACDAYQINYNDSALTDAVQKQIEATRKEAGSRSAYKKQLEKYYLTDHLFRFTLLAEQAQNELYFQLRDFIGKVPIGDTTYDFYGNYAAPADYAEFYNDYLTVQSGSSRIPSGNLIPVDYFFIQNDAGEDPEVNRALAASYREQLLAADPSEREELIGHIIGSDKNCAYTGVGPYFIVRGTYTDEFWDGVSGLSKEGDVSPVIETTGGYYVAVRVAPDEAKLLAEVQTLMKEYQSALVESYIEEIKAGLSVELNEYGKSLNLLEISMR